MKRGRASKASKKEEITEIKCLSPSVNNIVRSARISDLNQSKYLSPCRGVGLTKKRKIYLNILSIDKNDNGETKEVTRSKSIKENIHINSNEREIRVSEDEVDNKNFAVEEETAEKSNHDVKNLKQSKNIQRTKSIKSEAKRSPLSKSINTNNVSNNELQNENPANECVKKILLNAATEETQVKDTEAKIEKPQNDEACLQSSGAETISVAIDNITLTKDDCNSTDTPRNHKLVDTSIVVINKRLNKNKVIEKLENAADSDPDFEDVPLSKVAKLENIKKSKSCSEAITSYPTKAKSLQHRSKRIEMQKTSHSAKLSKSVSLVVSPKRTGSNLSESSLASSHGDDDDDDDFVVRKTILERKSYNNSISKKKSDTTVNNGESKVNENKQNKAYTENIKELESLVLKWRKGCQDALGELLEVSKEKMSGNENIEMESLLNMLNIPAELVKYNADESSFE